MLKFIFGLPASGKTHTVMQMIKEDAQNGRRSVLLVPEQFSFESERSVLKTLGDRAARSVSVMSFSRLCDEIGRNTGGIAGRTLNDGDKVIFMNRALSAVEKELKLWPGYCRSVAFAKTMLDTVGEFKINSVTPQDIRNAALSVGSGKLSAKLNDTALIYETYDTLTGEKFIDPADALTKLYRQLEQFKYFRNKTVYIESFKGFTGQQFKIIDRILAQADDVTVALTDDIRLQKEFNIFSNIRKAAERIRKSAKRFGVEEAEPIFLGESRYNSKSLSALERLIAGGEPVSSDVEGITVCEAALMFDEAEFAARTIRRLVRENGIRYRDFVIIARDAEQYETAVLSACAQNGIPCFADRRIPLASFPVSAAVSAAAEAALSPTTDAILRFNKTGLGTLSKEEISILENYTALWGISGDMWGNEWDMNPKGFVSEERSDTDADTLKKINELRIKAWKSLEKFISDFKGTAADMARACVELLFECDAPDKLAFIAQECADSGNDWSGDALKQSYDKFMKLLDSTVTCFGEASLKKSDFCEALKLAVSFDSVGTVPRTLDEVTFGSADRIRPSRPKVAFILGANQGIFPKTVTSAGVFSANERAKLIESGIEISDGAADAMTDEDYLVYCNLCCPSDRLYISYSSGGLTGEKSEPSAFVSEITENIPCKTVTEPQEKLSTDNLPETAESAYSAYCRSGIFGGSDAATLKAAFTDDYIKKAEYLEDRLAGKPFSVTADTAAELYGREIGMSASKFDTYRRCRFYFFCKYGIGAKKLQPAEFDVLQRGTIVHFVLEKLVGKYKKSLSQLDGNELDRLVDEYINEYLDGVAGYRSVETQRGKFLVSRISRSLKEVVKQLAREFAQSEFEPVSCELKIGGKDADIPALKMPYDGGNIILTGSIDRVDEYKGYIRVIDYKTGSRKFKLPDVLFGLNLQMLIYLYAAVRNGGLDDGKAAGILYMPSKRDVNDTGMAMNGLIRNDSEIVSAMDKNMSGEFVPKLKLNKDGTVSRQCTSFISDKDFSSIFDYIEKLMRETGNGIASGDIAASPLDGRDSPACKYCDYSAVCGREGAPCERVPDLKNEEVFEKMGEAPLNGIQTDK